MILQPPLQACMIRSRGNLPLPSHLTPLYPQPTLPRGNSSFPSPLPPKSFHPLAHPHPSLKKPELVYPHPSFQHREIASMVLRPSCSAVELSPQPFLETPERATMILQTPSVALEFIKKGSTGTAICWCNASS